MDVNDLRSIVTVVSMLTFAGIVAWALRRSNKARFDEAALLPFADEAPSGSGSSSTQGRATGNPAQQQTLKDQP